MENLLYLHSIEILIKVQIKSDPSERRNRNQKNQQKMRTQNHFNGQQKTNAMNNFCID